MIMKTSWRKIMERGMRRYCEGLEDIDESIQTVEECERELDCYDDDGTFTIWTKTRLYVLSCQKGYCWVAGLPRND